MRIFLSSTQLDLGPCRKRIIKFLDVLRSEIVAMEFFGSDENKPVDYCLEQVRKADLFIGVYAARYGSIDSQSGKSMVELEYCEALKMLEAGALRGLLIYMVHDKARWPLEFVERDPESMRKLEDLKQRIQSRHTVTFFEDTEELPLLVLRDVIQKVGIRSQAIFGPKQRRESKPKVRLDRPIGMEYYTDELAPLFLGRDGELDELSRQVIQHRMSLLIGASGIGKTSLVAAGLATRAREWGWSVAIVRPLTNPVANLRRSTWDQLLEGTLPTAFDFADVLRAATVAHKDRMVLLVIDQFEDLLGPSASAEIEAITQDLLNLFRGGPDNLKILVSYRGDVDHRVGTIWQKISGAATGLPRTYIGPLGRDAAQVILKLTLRALGLSLVGDEPSFIERVVMDIETESSLAGHPGIYPPFLQMVIARVFEECDADKRFRTERYFEGGTSRRIIAHYLMSQLRYLGDKVETGKQVLISLVNSYGNKDQKTLEEICLEAGVSREQAVETLGLLVDLRMVRDIGGAFEVAHDFLAKMIVGELVSAEEREAKKFKDLLSSRAGAYETTRTGLSWPEHLQIYKYRHRISCTDTEFRLLLESHLQGNGPIWYWARRYESSRLVAWTHALVADAHNEELRQSAYRFLIGLGERPDLSVLSKVFSDYNLQSELAKYIGRFATHNDLYLLFKLNRKKGDAVAEASEEALVRLVQREDVQILETMGKSRSKRTMRAFERTALRMSAGIPAEKLREGMRSEISWERVLCTHAIGAQGDSEDLATCQAILQTRVGQSLRSSLLKAVVRIGMRLGNGELVRALLSSKDKSVVQCVLQAVDTPCTVITISDVLKLYPEYPSDTSQAARALATKEDLPSLKAMLATVFLDPPARELVYALCSLGGEEEFSFLFDLFLNYDNEITFWSPSAVVERVSGIATDAHLPILESVISAEEFWDYYAERDRPQSRIPVRDYRNVHFIRRLVGAAYGRIARRENLPTIYRMLKHNYWVVWHAALHALSIYGDKEDLMALINIAGSTTSRCEGQIAAICTLDEKIYKAGANWRENNPT